MVILHIASITNSLFSGVCVIVPQHIRSQEELANVGFINIKNEKIDAVCNQMDFAKPFALSKLDKPFQKPDLVVFHEVYYVEYLAIGRYLKKNSVPYIIIPHGSLRDEAQKKKRLKKTTANILLFNRFIHGAAAIQCLSQKELGSTRFSCRKFIGTNGVNMPDTRKVVFSEDSVRFLYIGRLETHIKGLDILLEAVGLRADVMREKHCTLDIYGPDYEGQYKRIEEFIREKKLGDIVCLHHEISGAEKERMLLAADVFIQTSRSEGMPLGLLEAMSYGLPCVITEGTSLGEYVRQYDAGWVAETDAEAIAAAMEKAIEEKNRWQLKSENARKLAEENFSWEKITEKTIEQYEVLKRTSTE